MIAKEAHAFRVAPNLRDYEAECRAFSWNEARRRDLSGLPGGGLNIAHEAVDRHASGPRADRVALRWRGRRGERRDITYGALARESSRFANLLASLGVTKGDRVFTLLDRVPELYVSALGTLKAGAVLSPMFSAFGPEPLRSRPDDWWRGRARHHAGTVLAKGRAHPGIPAAASPTAEPPCRPRSSATTGSTRTVHNRTDKPINCQLNQNEILCHPGQFIEDVLNDDAILIANTDGETVIANRTSAQPRKRTGNWNLQLVNLKGKTKQFEIGEIGAWSEPFLDDKVYWRGWNHYPVQLIPSDGTCVYTNDRPSSTCPATFNELRHKDGNNIEAMVMYGLTDKQPGGLTALNRSWNFAPTVTGTNGCVSLGYEQRERAFKVVRTAKLMGFTLRASKEQPLERHRPLRRAADVMVVKMVS